MREDTGSTQKARSADEKRASGTQGSGGEATKSGKTVAGGTDGEATRSGTLERTGASGEGTSSENEASREGDERAGSGPPNTLLAGASDRTGGVLTEHRMVSYYGHPLSGAMGVLGQLEPEAMVREIKAQVQECAARMLSQIVRQKDLTPKVMVIHQFQSSMIQDKRMLESVPNVQIALHAHGFGTPRQKIVKYKALVRDAPIQYGGFKLFYDQDVPLLSPRETLRILEPNPALISHQ